MYTNFCLGKSYELGVGEEEGFGAVLVDADFNLVVAAIWVGVCAYNRTIAESAVAHAVALLILRERF